MASRSYAAAAICLLAVTLTCSTAAAQYIGSSPGDSSSGIRADPQGTFSEQGLAANLGDVTVIAGPLSNPKFGSRDEAGFHAIRNPSGGVGGGESGYFLQTGLAFGAAPGFEIGVFTPPALISPEFAKGDLPVFLTWATRGAGLDMGLRSTLTIPTDIDSSWRWNPGLHLLARFDGGRVDIGAFFPMNFINDETLIAGFDMPVRVSLDVSNDMYLGLESGVRKRDFGGENDLFVPLGFHALYSLGLLKHRVDIGARFFWDAFFWAGAPEDTSDRVLQNLYSITIGASFLFDVGDGHWPPK